MHTELLKPVAILSEQELEDRERRREFYRNLPDEEKAKAWCQIWIDRNWPEMVFFYSPRDLMNGFQADIEPLMVLAEWQQYYSTVLRYFWRNAEDNWRQQDKWLACFELAKNFDGVVTKVPFEAAHFDSFDDPVIVYRGCGSRNRHGLSWSLRHDVARSFALQACDAGDDGVILCGQIPKRSVLAYMESQYQYEFIFPYSSLLNAPECKRVSP